MSRDVIDTRSIETSVGAGTPRTGVSSENVCKKKDFHVICIRIIKIIYKKDLHAYNLNEMYLTSR